jgi:class 3 adenylate cyclase
VKTILKVKGEDEACYRYRIPFKFFDARVGVVELVFTEKSILGPVNRAALLIVLLGVFMLSVGIAIAVKSAASMVRPVTYLTEGVGRVSGGDLDVQIEVLSHDEIGTLTREFNEMINHLREKLQMQKFVSKSTVSMIKERTKMGDIGLGGTRENLAFLFSDVRGFTAMSEKLKPEEVVSILNEYLDLQAEIIKRFEGDIDKFVGDEVMAVFSGGRRADNAISAAVEIVNAIRDLNRKKSRQGQHIAEVGIGLNIGEVVSGRIGSRDRMDNTSIGDTVNLAARLCSYAEAGAIIASKEIVARASRKKFTGKKLDPIRVKGKAEAIEVFQITGMAQ